MHRCLGFLLAASLVVVGGPARAASCVLAVDSTSEIVLSPHAGPDRDIRELSVDVTPTSLRFRLLMERVPSTPPPVGLGIQWEVEFSAPCGEVKALVFWTAESDGAQLSCFGSGRLPFSTTFSIEPRTSTVTVDVPYDQARLRVGQWITDISADSIVFHGVAPDGRRTGYEVGVDSVGSDRDIVVGSGCR